MFLCLRRRTWKRPIVRAIHPCTGPASMAAKVSSSYYWPMEQVLQPSTGEVLIGGQHCQAVHQVKHAPRGIAQIGRQPCYCLIICQQGPVAAVGTVGRQLMSVLANHTRMQSWTL